MAKSSVVANTVIMTGGETKRGEEREALSGTWTMLIASVFSR